VDVPERANGPAGSFLARVPVEIAASGAGSLADGTLTVRPGGTVTGGYVDGLRGNGQPDVTVEQVSSAADRGAAPGVAVVAGLDGNGTRVRAQPGDGLIVRLDDANSNRTAGVDTATVTLTASTGAGGAFQDDELVRVVETGPNTGVFTGAVPLRAGGG